MLLTTEHTELVEFTARTMSVIRGGHEVMMADHRQSGRDPASIADLNVWQNTSGVWGPRMPFLR
jgi:hypothetical protein